MGDTGLFPKIRKSVDLPGVGGVDPLELAFFVFASPMMSPRLEVELRPLVDLL